MRSIEEIQERCLHAARELARVRKLRDDLPASTEHARYSVYSDVMRYWHLHVELLKWVLNND